MAYGRFIVVQKSDMTVVGEVADINLGGIGYMAADAEDDYIYVAMSGSDGRLIVVDVTDKTAPTVVATLESALLAHPTSVMHYGTGVYVASAAATSMVTISVVDPTAPVLFSTLTHASFTSIADIVATGTGYGAVACPDTTSIVIGNEFRVVDELVSAAHFTGIQALATSAGGGYLYAVATGSQRVTVIDAFDPTNLSIVGYYENAVFATANDIVVEGAYAYVGTSDGKVVVLNVSQPTSVTLIVVYSNSTDLGEIVGIVARDGDVFTLDAAGSMSRLNFRSTDRVTYGEYPFPYDGTYDTDSRLTLTLSGPATVLAVTYHVDDTDNPASESG
jgi:hypothetical protein